MIIKDHTDSAVERHKQRLRLTGDVYLIKGVLIESLESHKRLISTSTATTIEEAEAERIAYELELEQKRREQQEKEEPSDDSNSEDPEED